VLTSPLAFAASVVCVVIWLYLVVAHGHFWMVQRLGAEVPPAENMGSIAVVMPARNEEEVIGEAISSLLRQSHTQSLHIVLVDDHSSDGTAALAREAALRAGHSDQLTVIAAAELPGGWTGKLWAVRQGIEWALSYNPRFLLLTDADIQHSPENVATLVAISERGGYDLVSFMVKLNCRSFAERLLIPAFVFFFFLLYPPEWIRDPRRTTAGAAGGCVLIRPEALQRAGGIAAIRNEIIDDCALARAVKRSGGKVWLGVTPNTVSLRAYRSFGEIANMIARTAFNQLQHSAWMLLGALAGLMLTYLLPLGLLFSRSRIPVCAGAVACLLMFLSYVPMVRFYGLPTAWALTLPFAAVFYMGATVLSAIRHWLGRGGEWKGRAQDAARSRSTQ
jgi:hopene-associated glycosyltransferase HpnB